MYVCVYVCVCVCVCRFAIDVDPMDLPHAESAVLARSSFARGRFVLLILLIGIQAGGLTVW
jgi:hypothetical protein